MKNTTRKVWKGAINAIYKKMYFEHIKGLKSEQAVVESLKEQGWQLLHQRYKTPFAEVDLVFSKLGLLRIVEVKTVANWDFVPYRLSKKQKNRLILAFQYFQQRFKGDVVLELALVSCGRDILFIEIENIC